MPTLTPEKDTLTYAQARANETARPYIISSLGHCAMDCATNRKAFEAIGCTIAARILPNYSPL